MKTEAVGLREFSNAVSTYVRRAAIGVRVLLTDRGRVIAEIVQPNSSLLHGESKARLHPMAQELSNRGTLKLATSNSFQFSRGTPLVDQGTALAVINELRAE